MALATPWSRMHARLYWTLLAPHLLILLSSRWGLGTAALLAVASFLPYLATSSLTRPLACHARDFLCHPRIAVRILSVLVAGFGPTAITMFWLANDGRRLSAERNLLWLVTLAAFILWTTDLSRILRSQVAAPARPPPP